MLKFVIRGEKPLRGSIKVSGSKNASVAILPAALMAESSSVIENIPQITDVQVFREILTNLGARLETLPSGALMIDPNGLDTTCAPYELVKRLRASYYLVGALLARFGKAEVALPGGCDIGLRPVDQHIKGLRALGAEVVMEHGIIKAQARKLHGAQIYLDVTSVGATINIMLAATMAEGVTIIENAAKEPHIVDLANYLNGMGGKVQGAGTDVIKIRGVERLKGTTHCVIPDEIEASTYMLAAIATRGDLVIQNTISKHLESVAAKLREVGATVEMNGEHVHVVGPERPKAANVKTLPYPGFPTDLQQPYVATMARADGISVIQETIYDNRFGYANELVRMGASIRVDGRTAIVEGVERLYGAPVRAGDLRAGAALVLAGLSAKGTTEVYGVEFIDRGYEDMAKKLASVGADIVRVE